MEVHCGVSTCVPRLAGIPLLLESPMSYFGALSASVFAIVMNQFEMKIENDLEYLLKSKKMREIRHLHEVQFALDHSATIIY